MTRLVFVTPVHGRPEMTAVCLAQRVALEDEAARFGVAASSVVVGDDENLEVADALGMAVIPQTNVLGLKINDGIEYACRELGADYVCFIGSDQWLHPSYLEGLEHLERGRIRTGAGFATVNESGMRIAHLWLPHVFGCGPKLIPAERLAVADYRPCDDTLTHSLDGSLMEGIVAHEDDFEWFDPSAVACLRYVDFKSPGANIHPYAKLRRHAHREERSPWSSLREHYPPGLVDEMAGLYRARVRAAA